MSLLSAEVDLKLEGLKEKVLVQLVVIGLNAVIVAVTEKTPRILTVNRAEHSLAEKDMFWAEPQDAIPFGPFDPSSDRTLELGLRRWVREQTGLDLGYVEQLYTFGNRNRDPSERKGGPRVISVAYLALVHEGKPSGAAGAQWREWYHFLPWEDWRAGRPRVIDKEIAPALNQWVRSAPDHRIRAERRERSDINFGMSGAPWVPERVLERYELVYEVGLAGEAKRDRIGRDAGPNGYLDAAQKIHSGPHLDDSGFPPARCPLISRLTSTLQGRSSISCADAARSGLSTGSDRRSVGHDLETERSRLRR